jgi:tetratricopeptide (TPR) repeat protein
LAQFQNALKLNKDYLEVQYNLALLYFKSTFFDKTDEFLPPPSIRIQRGIERIEKINSNKPELLNSNYPKIQKFLEKENYEALVKFLEESRSKIFIQDAVNLIGTSFYLKFMYGGKGLDNEIIKKYESKLEAALEIFPDYADIWNNLGIIHLIQCRNLFLQALSEFKRSLEINPGFDKARKNKKLVENDGKEFLILLRAILK